MTADKDYLYIFLHIPKTAGSTFSFHIQKNLKENERLLLTYDLLCINSRRPPMDAQVYRNKAWEYMSKISREEKRNIKVIYGHIVPYGIHKLFDRPARYITIFRDPVKRVKSIYKYKVGLYLKDSQLERKTGDYETTLLIKNQVPLFKDWLSNKYNPKRGLGIFSMTQTLKLYGYLTTTSVCGIKDALNKFYFIGISQNYNSESLFTTN
jgi:hypothetical protein